jgi:hypothetical protein
MHLQQIGVDIQTDDVKGVRDLRHLLSHRRGALRTEELRKKYAASADALFSAVIDLDEPDVLGAIDALAGVVRQTDACVYEHTWGPRRVGGLAP